MNIKLVYPQYFVCYSILKYCNVELLAIVKKPIFSIVDTLQRESNSNFN